MNLVLRFALSFIFVAFLGMCIKYTVDVCLPDQGNTVFTSFFKLPQNFCDGVKAFDLSSRRNTRIDKRGIHFGKHSTGTQGITGVTWLVLSRPTIFFVKFPKNPMYLTVFFILVFILALLFSTLWHLAWLQVEEVVAGSSAKGAAEDHPEISRTDFSRATYELITDSDPQDELTEDYGEDEDDDTTGV